MRVARELNVSDKAIDKGLKGTRWPGRLEHIETERGLYILDGAHNPDGAQALAAYLQSGKSIPPSFFGPNIPKNPPVCLVFGALADKAWPQKCSTSLGSPDHASAAGVRRVRAPPSPPRRS